MPPSPRRGRSATKARCEAFAPRKAAPRGPGSAPVTAAPTALTTFPQFSKLPPELRLQIWQLYSDTMPEVMHPLRLRLYKGHERVTRNNRQTYKATLRLTPMPELGAVTRTRRQLTSICREARYEFLRWRWPARLEINKDHVVLLNAATDIVFLDIRDLRVMDDLVEMRRNNEPRPQFAGVIRHLGFEMCPREPHWATNSQDWLDPRLDFLLCFPALRSMSLVNFVPFEAEIKWDSPRDVAWLTQHERNHQLHFRYFSALADTNYKRQSSVGTRAGHGSVKHDCVICTIHKCLYVRDFMWGRLPPSVARPPLTREENRWLSSIDFHTLIAATPIMRSTLRRNFIEFGGLEAERLTNRPRRTRFRGHVHGGDGGDDNDEDDEVDEDMGEDIVDMADLVDLADMEHAVDGIGDNGHDSDESEGLTFPFSEVDTDDMGSE